MFSIQDSKHYPANEQKWLQSVKLHAKLCLFCPPDMVRCKLKRANENIHLQAT